MSRRSSSVLFASLGAFLLAASAARADFRMFKQQVFGQVMQDVAMRGDGQLTASLAMVAGDEALLRRIYELARGANGPADQTFNAGELLSAMKQFYKSEFKFGAVFDPHFGKITRDPQTGEFLCKLKFQMPILYQNANRNGCVLAADPRSRQIYVKSLY